MAAALPRLPISPCSKKGNRGKGETEIGERVRQLAGIRSSNSKQ
jgi:hypothetical protein